MDERAVIRKTELYVQETLAGDGTGHDWWHIDRVRKMALHIGKAERADFFIVELGALLHDIADHKFYGGDDLLGGKVATQWLQDCDVPEYVRLQVSHIVDNVSFKGAKVASNMSTLEGRVVQDADRLDGLGAIGIARTFAYGGKKGRPLYDPNTTATLHDTFDEYKKGAPSTLHHFEEKLFHLKGLMNTETGRKIAEERHKFLVEFYNRFLREWAGEI